MKHTPGPWKLDHDVIVSIENKNGDWPTVCKRDEHSVIDSYVQWTKNAHLIAAAPEMLEALEVAQHIIEKLIPLQKKYGVGIGRQEQMDLDLINKAIAKAKGNL